MNNGWITLHRKLLKAPYFKDPEAVQLWIWLLLNANHKNNQAVIGAQVIEVKRGQLLTGRKSMVYATGVSRSKVERLLKLFEKLGQIEQQTTNKYRIISIVNYESYQSNEQQMSNKRATDEQQMGTNNNITMITKETKNTDEKKVKNNIPYKQITELYHQHLPNNPSIVSLSVTRKSHIKARWNNDIKSIENWEKYFKHIAKSEFLTGRAYTPPGKKPFFANIDWIINESNMLKILEGNYHGG